MVGCNSDHGGVRSLCGLRGMKNEKSGHGRSRLKRLTVEEKSGGGSAPFAPPGNREIICVHSTRSALVRIRGSSTAATTMSISGISLTV